MKNAWREGVGGGTVAPCTQLSTKKLLQILSSYYPVATTDSDAFLTADTHTHTHTHTVTYTDNHTNRTHTHSYMQEIYYNNVRPPALIETSKNI